MPGIRTLLALIAALALLAAACEAEDIEEPLEEDEEAPEETEDEQAVAAPGLEPDEDATIVELLAGHGSFSEFVSDIEAAGLEGQLSGAGPFTVFAPTDEAYDVLPEHERERLLDDPEMLEQFVLGHVADGEHPADGLGNGEAIPKLDGTERQVLVSGDGDIFVGSAQVIEPDVQAQNGVIHVIDFVLPSSPAEPDEEEEEDG
jgi:uncharacterized surface protein with fasciclin (FAS1) repeats